MLTGYFKTYEGNEPYIFASYSHKDADVVIPLLKLMNDNGYRVWYDEGITPGSEWPEDIANHLNNSSVVIAFISQNAMDSVNCRREITFALSKNKKFIGLIISPTNMPLGMELQISSQQCIILNNFTNQETGALNEAKFLEKLANTDGLSECNQISLDALEDEIAKEKEAAMIAQQKLEEIKRAKALRQEAEAEARRIAAEEAEKKRLEQEEKSKKEATEKKPIPKMAMIIIPLVLLLVIGGFFIFGGGSKNDGGNVPTGNGGSDVTENITPENHGDGEPVFDENAEELVIENQDIDESVLAQIAKMEKLKKLKIVDCTMPSMSFDEWKVLPLEELSIINTDLFYWTDFKEFKSLKVLNLVNVGMVDDVAANIKGANIEELNVSNNPINNLDFVPNSVKKLNISDTYVNDISSLLGYENLESLNVNNCKIPTLLQTVVDLNLLELNAENCSIETYTGEKTLKRLDMKVLDLANNPKLTNIKFADNQTRLECVDLSNTGASSADCVLKSKNTLWYLNIGGASFSRSFLEQLSDNSRIRRLNISGIQTSNLDFLSNMNDLDYLKAIDCGISNISALSNVGYLQVLNLAANNISDTSVLGSMKLDINCRVMDIDLTQNPVSDLSTPEIPITVGYSVVSVALNPSFNYSSIKKMNNLDCLIVDYNDALLEDEGVSGAIKTFMGIEHVVILNVPDDKKLDLYDLYGENKITFTTKDAFVREYNSHSDILDVLEWNLD